KKEHWKKNCQDKKNSREKTEEHVAETEKHTAVKPENRDLNIPEKSEGTGRSGRKISAAGEQKTG
ncbi:TPA: hypothetical protein HA351_13665, partial [Methanosarcinaceae archaeon]|nr:hypothetical protein [Methanosarcinaceae archaeon]